MREDIKGILKRGVGVGVKGVVVEYAKISCCRMEQYEDLHVESSDEEVQVVAPVPGAVVGLLNMEVAEIPDNPESPSPQPSPVSPQPYPASTVLPRS